jgi:hypothetical protein
MPDFQVFTNATNTASATVPLLSLTGSATSQIGIFEINAGSDATADNAVKYSIARHSARGTNSATITPTALDQNVTQASLTTADSAWNINPTITASSAILQWGMHQRATYRWVAYDYTKFLRSQAGTAKGMVLLSVVVSSAFNGVFSVSFTE